MSLTVCHVEASIVIEPALNCKHRDLSCVLAIKLSPEELLVEVDGLEKKVVYRLNYLFKLSSDCFFSYGLEFLFDRLSLQVHKAIRISTQLCVFLWFNPLHKIDVG